MWRSPSGKQQVRSRCTVHDLSMVPPPERLVKPGVTLVGERSVMLTR